MKKFWLKMLNIGALLFVLTFSNAKSVTRESKLVEKDIFKDLDKGLYCAIITDYGNIVIQLYDTIAPKTVKNFVDLATGQKEWLDPITGKKVKKRFYDGLIFHRVIPGFMIQGGCPLKNGTGGPGYTFEDECVPEVKFDREGRLAMANRGPNTNGSQFFITVAPTPWLDMKHTIFGQVVRGIDVVNTIANVPRDNKDKPLTDVVIKKVLIKRIK
jgi:peptidyl-prolyl cis-trans isomerase A (cyclophilin A)